VIFNLEYHLKGDQKERNNKQDESLSLDYIVFG